MRSCVLFLAIATLHAQPLPQTFDVVSIKPNQTAGEYRRAGTSAGGLFTASNVTLKLLISRAYGVAEAQIEGGPGWIDTDTFDISARANTPLTLSREEVRPCLQALLAQRFHLATHTTTRQGNVFSLTVAKNGPKFQQHSGEGKPSIGVSSDSSTAAVSATKTPMARLTEYLSAQAGRPVIDNTALPGDYDFRVEWSTDLAKNPSAPSIFTALQEQLGLKLEATKGPIHIIVVDRAEQPSEN